MEGFLSALQQVFSSPKYLLLFAALVLILFPLYAVLTDIVVTSPLSFNPNLRLPEAVLIALVALLASAGFTIAAYQFSELRSVSKKSVGSGVIGAGASGSALAAFASACTICQPIWLVWLGLGSASAFLIDYGIYIALASIALLLFSIQSGLRAIYEGCRLKKAKR